MGSAENGAPSPIGCRAAKSGSCGISVGAEYMLTAASGWLPQRCTMPVESPNARRSPVEEISADRIPAPG